jgi:hypothetical protein
VAMLNLIDHPRRLSRGEDVLAVYPDTTSFYPALVAAAPRRATSTTEAAVAVQFHGDENDKGKNTLDVMRRSLMSLLCICRRASNDNGAFTSSSACTRWMDSLSGISAVASVNLYLCV